MDHDHELLYEEVVRRSSTQYRGPIAEFLAKKMAEQKRKTFLGYRTELLRLSRFLGEDATVGDLDESAGHRYLSYLKEQSLSENSIATAFRCLKAFTRWLAKKGWTERDRFEDVKRPQFIRPKFDTLSLEEKQAIVGAYNPDTFLGARNLAILCLFLDTGIRLEELVHLREEQVLLEKGYIEVYSRKTDAWRIVPVSPETVAICQNYLKWRRKFLEAPIRHRAAPDDVNHRVKSRRQLNTDTFFCAWNGAPLTENGVGHMVRRLRSKLAETGQVIRLHPHLFRHNFLTEKALDGEKSVDRAPLGWPQDLLDDRLLLWVGGAEASCHKA